MHWKNARFGLVSVLGLAALAAVILLVPLRFNSHTIELTTHFQNGAWLREGAPVLIAGVDVGKVAKVRVRPEVKDGTVEVVISLATPYELQIPDDSVASLRTAGLLGGTYVNIDSSHASGPPVVNHGQLKSQEPQVESAESINSKARRGAVEPKLRLR